MATSFIKSDEQRAKDRAAQTPGPWRAGYLDEQDRKERMIVRAEMVDGQPYVAICPNPILGSHEANARLIAAAPDLLAAAKAALRVFKAQMMSPVRPISALVEIETAIAKAEGR